MKKIVGNITVAAVLAVSVLMIEYGTFEVRYAMKHAVIPVPQEYVAQAQPLSAMPVPSPKAVSAAAATPSPSPTRKPAEPLPVVGTYENFERLMEEMQGREEEYTYAVAGGGGGMGETLQREAMEDAVAAAESAAPAPMPAPTQVPSMARDESAKSAASYSGAEDGGYSETNTQVEGVDEADVIKTDGQYIYYAAQGGVRIVKAAPADKMELVSSITFGQGESGGFAPTEMYADGNELIVIGNASRMYRVDNVPNYQTMTRACVYDITDRANPVKSREVESEGNYVSSRKIGKALYMVSSSWIYRLYDGGVYPMPMYRDTAASAEYQDIGYGGMRYFPGFSTSNYLFITGFETDRPEQRAKVETILGAGQSVYASVGNMYIASSEYEQAAPSLSDGDLSAGPSAAAPAPLARDRRAPMYGRQVTAVYRFALGGGGVTYDGRQTVPGTILNQFSMDEYDGHFRIATTSYNDSSEQVNGLYILDGQLKLVGKIDDIAPGERIYSTRFMQKRAYMVTFKTVDPLFAIDLSDPENPRILGALKIPGYSDYLHPYDENHLIGFGKDTVVTKGTALYQGMKMSLFDVTDVSNPKELFVETIGDRGTESPLLYDHKALLFDRERGLLAFPISVMELTEQQRNSESAMWEYGSFKFQGAYVYGLDLESGFKLKGSITHMNEQELLKTGMYNWNGMNAVERIIRVGETLYTASQGMIKSTGLADMKNIGSVDISGFEQ